eukprot:365310-Chlamydomonas_euryale.AAC.2
MFSRCTHGGQRAKVVACRLSLEATAWRPWHGGCHMDSAAWDRCMPQHGGCSIEALQQASRDYNATSFAHAGQHRRMHACASHFHACLKASLGLDSALSLAVPTCPGIKLLPALQAAATPFGRRAGGPGRAAVLTRVAEAPARCGRADDAFAAAAAATATALRRLHGARPLKARRGRRGVRASDASRAGRRGLELLKVTERAAELPLLPCYLRVRVCSGSPGTANVRS